MKKIISAFAFLLLLSACADAPPPVVQQDVDTSPKINLDVLTVVVIDRSESLVAGTPYATNNLQPTIANALRRWATDKLIAVGSTGEAIVVIRDANLKAQALSHSDDWFTREQASKYSGRAAVDIEISAREGQGRVSAEASHFETLPETPTTLERQNAYNKVLNALMRDIGANLRAGIRDHLNKFVITAPILPQ
jgi:hypothetical protein